MRTIFLIIIVTSLASCKDPLPVYFDKPLGEKESFFSENIQGYYYILDDIINEGKKKAFGNYILKEGKITIMDTSSILNASKYRNADSTNDETVPSFSNDTSVSAHPEETNEFYQIVRLNKLSFAYLDTIINSIDHKNKIVFGFLKITSDKISLLHIDSLGRNYETTLWELGEQLKLSSYRGTNYLNFKTPFGWEIVQIDEWDKGNYLNFRPFYFTDYDDKTGNANSFLKSTQTIYPNLKPIYNSEKFIIGLKGKIHPALLAEKFKKSELNFVFLKVD